MRHLVKLVSLCVATALPLNAQSIQFGDDASQWSNDGECDDPRFQGAGMTTTPLLDDDIMHDASDCRAAFDAGTITLRSGSTKSDGKKSVDLIVDGINFGTDSGEWAADGECDDRRFSGPARSVLLSWEYLGTDATDCAAAYNAGLVYLWNPIDAAEATQCNMIDFGDDSGEFPDDLECDDPRFEGQGSSMALGIENAYGDATDCKRMCDYGIVFLREYQ
ncbi:hypothetical protein BVC71_00920 [Marivivens niveibacter]|uniref:Uncharacterized protein n=1 Tax=Marivivens niveibacter TaxID=1930667 RepID=A0A251X0G0_9RHOB|nr:hypothetical protein [Marivivens niveibacter]OUD10112.1 hypothetical protein BVC71_00920 [Marivivens niveibacter]